MRTKTALFQAALSMALTLAGATVFTQPATPVPNLPEPKEPLDIRMSSLPYPFPVSYYDLTIEGRELQMAYMDIAPEGAGNGQTIVLLHGGLGFAATFKNTIPVLTKAGYRVVVPDQIGFGKSSKEVVRYSMRLWSKNTHDLLTSLGVQKAALLGHSMGGGLAIRYALMYPAAVSKLVLENPLGLEDYGLAVPFKTVDELTEDYAKASWGSIQALQASTYAHWRDEYADNARALFRMTKDPNFRQVAYAQATIQSAILWGEPIVYELRNVAAPTLITWGEKDRTAPGKGYAAPALRSTLGDFPKLVANAVAQMPQAKAVQIDGVAHVPHVEDPGTFHRIILEFLSQ